MPFKANASRRHHILKQTRKVSNWADCNASLRRRGSLTLWFSEDAIAGWRAAPRTTRGGQAWYSALAILTAPRLQTQSVHQMIIATKATDEAKLRASLS